MLSTDIPFVNGQSVLQSKIDTVYINYTGIEPWHKKGLGRNRRWQRGHICKVCSNAANALQHDLQNYIKWSATVNVFSENHTSTPVSMFFHMIKLPKDFRLVCSVPQKCSRNITISHHVRQKADQASERKWKHRGVESLLRVKVVECLDKNVTISSRQCPLPTSTPGSLVVVYF
jgi:hypothetical protein